MNVIAYVIVNVIANVNAYLSVIVYVSVCAYLFFRADAPRDRQPIVSTHGINLTVSIIVLDDAAGMLLPSSQICEAASPPKHYNTTSRSI